MIKVDMNEALESELSKELTDFMGAAAEGAARGLGKRLGHRSEPRTGKKWPDNPRVSSALGEYPQEQTGSLKASVDSTIDSSLKALVGFQGEDFDKLRYLEFDGKGVRRPLFMYFEGKDSDRTLKIMASAIRKAVRSR